ncbi:Retrovirus-related Pol polyprotein from transposon opus [Araneus ventricosus]|uniref:RNA-directed DNA polymerase n=1 Tax=Araneus ventricosus TaxID=182803 RepID=A0A4Y2XAR6_ARAVE|nr:Retrovirus-related Pol polyprotein from transposon opus [Araneus ventricosus]
MTATGDLQKVDRLFITDRTSGLRFLVDSGASISCVPAKIYRGRRSSNFMLSAANSTRIHVPKTAVITPLGLYEYKNMCFGLRNAAQTFQRYLDSVIRDLDFCYTYLDDVLVASPDEDSHKRDLESLFQCLSKNGIVINPDKCVYGQTRLSYLGFHISAAGLKPLPEKVETILNYPLPDTVNKLRRFLAIVNFYHRFIKNASAVQAPLFDLVKSKMRKDKSRIEWNESTLQTFEDCKQALSNAALLAFYDHSASLSLYIDASDIAIGSVLQQNSGGQSEPLAFFSRKLSDSEENYSTIDRELLDIYSAIHFRHMLEGREFTVFKDHKELLFICFTSPVQAFSRLQRHSEYISQFTTTIRRVVGDANVVADALSRISEISIPSVDFQQMALAQTTDEELQTLLNPLSVSHVFLRRPWTIP